MPKASKESASHVEDMGVLESRSEELGGYMVGFRAFREDADATPLFKGLPDDRCQSPHWGYVIKGQAHVPLRRPRRGLRGGRRLLRSARPHSCSRPAPRSSSSAPPRSTARRWRCSARNLAAAQGADVGSATAARMDIAPLDRGAAAAVEAAEARAWADLYAAAPPAWAAGAGLGYS